MFRDVDYLEEVLRTQKNGNSERTLGLAVQCAELVTDPVVREKALLVAAWAFAQPAKFPLQVMQWAARLALEAVQHSLDTRAYDASLPHKRKWEPMDFDIRARRARLCNEMGDTTTCDRILLELYTLTRSQLPGHNTEYRNLVAELGRTMH